MKEASPMQNKKAKKSSKKKLINEVERNHGEDEEQISRLITLARKRDIHQARENEEKNPPLGKNEVDKDKKHKRRKKKKKIELMSAVNSSPVQEATNSSLLDTQICPFPYVEEDCCETKADAYELIASFLDVIAHQLSKTRETLFIYDPFYCEGAMIRELNSLGFMHVYNRMEDFYSKQETDSVPNYDVLITNPPYSGDHVENLITFCIQSQKPYFLLMPNYFYTKDYFIRAYPKGSYTERSLFFVVPSKRLLYTTPKGRRQSKSGKYTSPFPTFWYCSLGQKFEHQTARSIGMAQSNCPIKIARNIYELPVEVLCDQDPRKKKERDKLKRAKNKARKKAKLSCA